MPNLKDVAHLVSRPGVRLQGITNRHAPSGTMPISVYLPIDAQSVANMRGKWTIANLKKHHRGIVALKMAQLPLPRLPIRVQLTRLYGGRGKKLDGHDNLRVAFKATVDAIAELYRVDDSDERIQWEYDQEECDELPRTARVFIEPLTTPNATA